MVNQICIAGVLQGLAEGIHFAQSAELDVEKVVEVISQGAAQSWMENRAHDESDKFDLDLRLIGCVSIRYSSKQEVFRQSYLLLRGRPRQTYEVRRGRFDTSSLLRR